MAVIMPNTNITLIKLPIELDEENQLSFTNAEAQYQYFSTLPNNITLNNATYVRKDNTLRFNLPYDDIINYNYLMYQNDSYSNKWFYAFITNIEYLSNESSAITFTTDTFQSWQFDLTYLTSFVEREHVNNDTIGLHTVSENLELGDYIIEKESDTSSDEECYTVVATTFDAINLITNESQERIGYKLVNGIPTGLHYYVVPTVSSQYSFLSLLLDTADSTGKADGVVSIFMIPQKLSQVTTWNYLYASAGTGGRFKWSTDPSSGLGYCPYIQISQSTASVLMETITINKPYSNIDGYVPRNNKMYVYPFKYLVCDNNNGSATNYMYEYFSSTPSFKIYGDITPGCSIRCMPENYKNQTLNNLEGLNAGKYPIGSWQSDVYTNWITQNGANIAVDLANSGISIATGVATENPTGVISGAMGIAGTLAEVYKHSLIPPQVKGNTNCGDVSFSTGLTKYTFYNMSIKSEYAKIIDNYLTAYGYRVNTFKVPNVTGRRNWNFVKTINCNIHGFIPNGDMNKIKEMFDSGVTIWHNANTFLDYSQNNGIV